MKKINLKRVSEILSEKELKNVMGGSGGSGICCKWWCSTINNHGYASSNNDCWAKAESYCPNDGFGIENHC